jgi:uncharacterized membrane protein YqiK
VVVMVVTREAAMADEVTTMAVTMEIPEAGAQDMAPADMAAVAVARVATAVAVVAEAVNQTC